MASDWMLQELQSSGVKPTNQPVAQPVQQPAQAQPSSAPSGTQPKVAISQPKQTQPVHGKLFSGNLVSKAMDVMQLPYYAIAAFNKGTSNKSQQLSTEAHKTGQSAVQKYGIGALADITKAGIDNIIPGMQNRTQYGREAGDYNAGKYVTDNAAGQEAINFTASLGAPNLPLGKVLSPLGKVASKVPGVSKVVEEAGNVGGKVLNAVRKNEGLATQLEKVPGLTYLRNPEAGKIIEQGKHAADARISSLYNTINDAAKGLTPAEREKVGAIIEGSIPIKTETKLAQRADYIKSISDQIGQEMVDQGLMSPETFAAYKGKYLHHIADTVRTEEMAKNISNKPVQFLTSSLKQRKNVLGSGNAPDYIRQFQFPTFKALGSEIKTAESIKIVKQLADKFGTVAEDQIPASDMSKELLNTLIKEKPKVPRPGLGEIPFKDTYQYKENPGLQVVDMLKEKLPAMTPEGTRMGTKLVNGKNVDKAVQGIEDITGHGTPGYSFPNVSGVAGIPGKTEGVSAKLGKVGSMPGVKQTANFLKVNTEHAFTRSMGGGPRVTKDGLVALEDLLPTKIAGQFKGVAVPKEIGDYISRSFKSAPPDIFDKAINAWKLGKTVYSGPGYHVRNILSNIILGDMQTGAGLPVVAGNYANATKTLLGKGSATMSKYLQEMKDAGVIGRTGLSQGIESLHPNVFGQGESLAKKIVSAPSNFQGAAEDAAKLNVYSLLRDKGHSVEDAAKMAEEAIFSPHRISQAERGAVRKVIPFYSFARQALPFTAKTALQHPERLTKYAKAKTAVESMSPNDTKNNANLPANLEGQVRLPIKDKQGNNAYADPTFVYPFGNFGDMGSASKLPFGLSVNPVAQEVAQQAFNKDLYFGQPIAKSQIPERAKAQRIQHAFQTLAPNIMPTDFAGGIPTGQPGLNLSTRGGDKLYSAFTGKKDYAGRTRSKTQAVADTFGLKSAFYDAPTQQKFDAIGKSKQLKDIRTEMKNVMQNKSYDTKTKREYIKQLNQQLLDVIHN